MHSEVIYRFFRDTRPLLEELIKDQPPDVVAFIVVGWMETVRTFEPIRDVRKACSELAGEEFSYWLLFATSRKLPIHLKLQLPTSRSAEASSASTACSSSSSSNSS
jgi:hypothetical protein